MKKILMVGAVLIIVLTFLLFFLEPKDSKAPSRTENSVDITETDDQNTEDGSTLSTSPAGKLKADTFVGTLTKVDTGCFADGECYVEVDGKHVTALLGFNQNEVGSVIGIEGFGDLENYIGKQVEVYAKDNSDGTYSLYGSSGFYIKPI